MKMITRIFIVIIVLCVGIVMLYVFTVGRPPQNEVTSSIKPILSIQIDKDTLTDTARYDQLLQHLVHDQPSVKWPVKAGYPLPGALFPYNRIIAFYGNLYSPNMGILGELSGEDLLKQLIVEVDKWKLADSCMTVIPALHYIAVTAQSTPGRDGKYRLRMPQSEIEKIFSLAEKAHAAVFLDVQPGFSTLQEELPLLQKYLLRPDVHLGIDPEYSMKNGQVPCTAIGTFDAEDINYAISWLATVVQQYHLPPKILVVHRFTQAMVTNYKSIHLQPEVQLVMNMDGFGGVAKKLDTYKSWISGQPVQFTGFKLFYKNDVATGGHLMQPMEVLALYPQPVYIQYQ